MSSSNRHQHKAFRGTALALQINSLFSSQFHLPRQHRSAKPCEIDKDWAPTELRPIFSTLEYTFLLKHAMSSLNRHQHKAFRGTAPALQITLHQINSLFSSQFRLPRQHRSLKPCAIDKDWAPTELRPIFSTLEYTFLLKHAISSSIGNQHKAFRGTALALQITLHQIHSWFSSQFRLPRQHRSLKPCAIDKDWAPTELRSDRLQLGQDRRIPGGYIFPWTSNLASTDMSVCDMTTGMNRVSETVGVPGHV